MLGAATAQAASGSNPAAVFSSNGVSASVRAVQPAVSGLFQVHAPRMWADAVGESGEPVANGVPDFLDSWDAFQARVSSAILKNGYAFKTIDGLQHEVLYAGVQRASTGGPSSAVLEFSQKSGERTLGDLRISVEIDAAGSVGAVQLESYAGEAKGAAKFLPIAILLGEGCNDAGSVCVVANGALVELGYNLTALGKPEKEFSGIQITTPEDHVVGTFSINPVSLPTVTCPSNLTTCTANDVTTTVKAVDILNNDLCTSLTDTIQLRITTAYAATSNERYDLGLFVSGDGGTVREPSTALICRGAAAQAGQGNDLAYPDGDTDLFLSIDPTGHSLTPSTTDTCGDLRASAGPVDWTVDATVACNIVNNQLRIPSCRVWEQNANHKTSCQTLQQAGTGSKCDCTDLVVTTQLNPCATTICNDDNVCTDDSCTVVGTPGNLSAQCVYTPANGGTQCRASTGVCDPAEVCDGSNSACPADAKSTSECRASAGACDPAEVCDGTSSACPADAKSTSECRASTGACDPAESCDGTSSACPADAKSTAECRASGGACDPAESCDGTSSACPDDVKSTSECRASAGVCDVAESCDGVNNTCPGDAFLGAATVCHASGGVCDPAENCTGSSAACPDDVKSTAVCRASAGVCDVAESCDGVNNTCPGDAFLSAATVCHASGGVCDPAENCTGSSAACPDDAKSTALCRAKNGVCDVAENCDGVNNDCPDDAVVPADPPVVCRGSDGSPCDPPEYCDGETKGCGDDLCSGGVRDPDVPKNICDQGT
jgi:hypothetical protein